MKRNASAIILILAIFLVLIGLNFVFFVDTSTAEESEYSSNRSSNRATPYGTLAYYTLLEENQLPVTRLEKPYTELNPDDAGTIVIISPERINNPSEEEFNSLTQWVEAGGLLIIIDRDINVGFGNSVISTRPGYSKLLDGPFKSTTYTRGVDHLTLSDYATRVKIDSRDATTHIGDLYGALVADLKVGGGRVVILTDPYVVANNGIRFTDNAVLALNLVAERPSGKIAFDEYHHGYAMHRSSSREGLLSYFRGTPIPWMFWQGALIVALVIYTFGRRFGRPLPLKIKRRTTNLEFVSSMANITRLASASDLAMQNIYGEFRKRLCRFTGFPVDAPAEKLAAAAARHAKINEQDVTRLLVQCEQVAQGKPVADLELLRLVARIREVESQLGI